MHFINVFEERWIAITIYTYIIALALCLCCHPSLAACFFFFIFWSTCTRSYTIYTHHTHTHTMPCDIKPYTSVRTEVEAKGSVTDYTWWFSFIVILNGQFRLSWFGFYFILFCSPPIPSFVFFFRFGLVDFSDVAFIPLITLKRL